MPALAARVRDGRPLSPATGMLKMPNHVRQAHGPGWALVGDAGYHRDAITGHGLSDAYRDAELLASALSEVLSGRATRTPPSAATSSNATSPSARCST